MSNNIVYRNELAVVVCVIGFSISLVYASPIHADVRRPNVLLLMADDLGFSDLGCYGSEIATPAIDSLAARAIMFSDFHTAATCSPTRAMLLTGVDHHRAGMGNMYEFLWSTPSQIGKPGYEGHLNTFVITIAEVLQLAGYHTAISGKWHVGNQLSVDQSPFGRGFDQSWVLWSGWAAHHEPATARRFVSRDQVVAFPAGRYSTDVYTDYGIEFVDQAIEQNKPFFLFMSYTAPHWPLEAPAERIAKQRGKYDAGYDELRKRRVEGLVAKGIFPNGVKASASPSHRPTLHHRRVTDTTPSWTELAPEQRRYSSRLMEVHAAMVESLDQNIGRLVRHLENQKQLENTLVIFLSDNGAAPLSTSPNRPGNELENVGRPGSFVGFGPEWAQACSGPLRLMKGHATEGGTRVPAIIKMPNKNEARLATSFGSVLDIAPTIYDIVGAAYPETHREHALHPLDGASMLSYVMGNSQRVHEADYSMGWELFGRAAYRRGKWKITWIEKPFGSSEFELFDISIDPGETSNVRETNPDIYQQMVDGFGEYARKTGVVIARPEHWQTR